MLTWRDAGMPATTFATSSGALYLRTKSHPMVCERRRGQRGGQADFVRAARCKRHVAASGALCQCLASSHEPFGFMWVAWRPGRVRSHRRPRARTEGPHGTTRALRARDEASTRSVAASLSPLSLGDAFITHPLRIHSAFVTHVVGSEQTPARHAPACTLACGPHGHDA